MPGKLHTYKRRVNPRARHCARDCARELDGRALRRSSSCPGPCYLDSLSVLFEAHLGQLASLLEIRSDDSVGLTGFIPQLVSRSDMDGGDHDSGDLDSEFPLLEDWNLRSWLVDWRGRGNVDGRAVFIAGVNGFFDGVVGR